VSKESAVLEVGSRLLHIVLKVRVLHQYTERLECEHCEVSYSWGAESAPWPCETAALVYSAEEIAEVQHWHRIWERWMRDVEDRKRLAHGWTYMDDMRLQLAKSVIRYLGTPLFADKLLMDPRTGQATVQYTVSDV
jgi:hypothetical protein